MLKRVLCTALTAAAFLLSAQAQTKLLRFPDGRSGEGEVRLLAIGWGLPRGACIKLKANS